MEVRPRPKGVVHRRQHVRHHDQTKSQEQNTAAASNGVYPTFFHGMLERGVALAPGPYEAMFPSLAHEDAHRVADTVLDFFGVAR